MRGYFRKRGKYWSFTVDIGRDPETGKRKQKTVSGFRTKKEAEKACAELIAQIENGGYREPKKITLGEFILDYMENNVKQAIRASTYSKQMNVVKKHILPDLGHLQLSKITPMDLQRLYTKKANDGYSPAYIKQIHAILCKTFRTAYEWEYIPKNISQLVSPPRISKKDIRVWSIEEANRFLSLTEKRRFYIVYVLALYTGMRKGEILALRWQDVDLEQAKLQVRRTLYRVDGELVFQEPKTRGSLRTITLPDFAVSALKQHKAKQNKNKLLLGPAYNDYDLVVCNGNGNPVDPKDINRDMKYVIQKYNLPKLRFHDLRHTHASILLQLGEHPKVVSERLGHSSISITLDTYSHVMPDMQKNLARAFDSAMKTQRQDEASK